MRNKKINKFLLCLFMMLSVLSPQQILAKDSDVLKSSRGVRKAGTYFIELAAEDEKGNPSIEKYRVHIRFPRTVLNYETMEGIDAHDLIYEPNTFDPNNVEEIVKRSGVHAWNMENGEPLSSLSVQVNEPKAMTGTISSVTIKTDKNTSLSVNVFEQEERYMNLSEVYMSQEPVVKDRFRTLSIFVVAITIVPILCFFILFMILSQRSKETLELLK